jgi:hypothetical protein
MDFSTALNNVYRNLCSSSNVPNQDYMAQLPLFSFPLLLQQWSNNQPLVSPPTTTTITNQASTPTPLQTSNSFDSNNGTNNSKFHGRHSIWRHFRVARDDNVYRCLVEECTAAYTWPPSTTVAGRHLRDKHPDIYSQVLNEEADRRNRKRAAEVGSNSVMSHPLSAALSDGSYSPPSSNPLGTPQPTEQQVMPQFEASFKRFKYDEDFLKQMGIISNLHFSEQSLLPPPSFDPFVSNVNQPTMDFAFKKGYIFEIGKKVVKFIVADLKS